MALVGPGSVQIDEVAPEAKLNGATEYEYVTILNPLSDDFAIRVAQDVPVNMPFEIRGKTSMVQGEGDLIRNYGLGLKNPEYQARKHIVNDTVIKAGQTINLKGNEAQVAVRQLVNEVLQREGKGRLMADPNLRREVEDRIVQRRGSIQELMDGNIATIQAQTTAAINKSNEVENAQPNTGSTYTPTVSAATASDGSGAESHPQERRVPGRPKQAR